MALAVAPKQPNAPKPREGVVPLFQATAWCSIHDDPATPWSTLMIQHLHARLEGYGDDGAQRQR